MSACSRPTLVPRKVATTSRAGGSLGADLFITYTLVVTNTGYVPAINLVLRPSSRRDPCFVCPALQQWSRGGISKTLVWPIPQLDRQRALQSHVRRQRHLVHQRSVSIENEAFVSGGTLTATVSSNRVNTPFDPNAIT